MFGFQIGQQYASAIFDNFALANASPLLVLGINEFFSDFRLIDFSVESEYTMVAKTHRGEKFSHEWILRLR